MASGTTVTAGGTTGLFSGTLTAISPVANLDAYDLLTSLAQDAHSGGNPLNLPISGSIAGVLNFGAFLQLSGPQVPGFGPPGLTSGGTPMDPENAQNSSSSVGYLKLRLQLPTSSILSGLLGVLPALSNPLLQVNC